ncbi:MAG: DNA repair protein RadC [Candidatus Diapherotrites archaeon]|nr:DNA repair protein RadC [Candidatus Diapherotrites archaeon]
MKILDISPENRPRERFSKLGPNALSDAELLAIILQKGTRGENVIDVSNRIIAEFGLEKLSSLSLTELQSINGIGQAKAMQIKAVFELNKRVKTKNGLIVLSSAQDIFEYLRPKMSSLDKEHFVVLLLDSKNKLIKEEIISIGTLNSSVIHPREIFKFAIKESANSIIIAHNHPSGDPNPSEQDKGITEKIVKAGEVIAVKVLDHVIIGKDSYYSFAEAGGI